VWKGEHATVRRDVVASYCQQLGMRALHPIRFLADRTRDLLVYDIDEREKCWLLPEATEQAATCALLLNHGDYDGSIDDFLGEHGEGKRVVCRGAICIEDNSPRLTGKCYGLFKHVRQWSFLDYPPFLSEPGLYVDDPLQSWASFTMVQE
jgi:hypothetical protein